MVPIVKHSLPRSTALHVCSRGVSNCRTGFSTEMLNWKQKWVIWPKIRLLPAGHCLVLLLNPRWSLGMGLWSLHVLPITRPGPPIVEWSGSLGIAWLKVQNLLKRSGVWGHTPQPLGYIWCRNLCTGYPCQLKATQDLGRSLHFQAAKWQLATYTKLGNLEGIGLSCNNSLKRHVPASHNSATGCDNFTFHGNVFDHFTPKLNL